MNPSVDEWAGQLYNRILLSNYREQIIHVAAWKGISRTLCSMLGGNNLVPKVTCHLYDVLEKAK